MKTRIDATSRRQKTAGSPRRFGKPDLARMGRFLREERQAQGLSLRALADRSGLSTGAIRALEAGQANPGLATVLAVVEAMDVDLDRAVEAARAGGQALVVHRAGEPVTESFSGAALGLETVELAAKSVGPPPARAEVHPNMGFIAEGAVVAVVRGGSRHRLETGDVYHAQPGTVQGLAGAGTAPARLLTVLDTRRTAERVTGRDEQDNEAQGRESR